jgi:hypothetical protein
MDVALAGTSALLFARVLITAGTYARRGGQVTHVAEKARVRADLCDQHRGDHSIDAGDLHQQRILRAIGPKLLIDMLIERSDVFIAGFKPPQLQHQQQAAMVVLGPSVERRG